MIVCSRENRPLVTAVTKWGILLPSVEPGTFTVLYACKNSRHMTEACHTKRSRTTAATAGSAPRINATQEADQQAHRVPSGSEELWTVSQRMTGSAFATAAVSTSASGSNNFSPQIKVLVDTGNLLSIGLCVSESFFLSLGGKLGDLWPPSFQTANGVSENSVGFHEGVLAP